jgi:hypothetical protein
VLALDMKSLFLPLALLVSGGSYYAEPFRIVAYGNSIISVSPTESAAALEACNFPMRSCSHRRGGRSQSGGAH